MLSVFHKHIITGKNNPLRLCIIFMISTLSVNANNITIKNSALTSQNTAQKTVQISFDLSWENSWRTAAGPKNWDAAWIFVKYRVSKTSGGDGLWRHVRLNSTGHFTPAGGTLKAVTEGVFIYRSSNGSGTFTANGVKLLWNYGSHLEKGNDDFIEDDDAIEIRVFGMEMVYVPTGAFYVGDGNIKDAFPLTQITTANASIIGAGFPYGYTNSNSLYPNGFNAFYCMKYEISQGQYVEFLNTLTPAGQGSCTSIYITEPPGSAVMTSFHRSYYTWGPAPSIYRSSIEIKKSGSIDSAAVYACNLNENMEFDEPDDGHSLACNFLLYSDITRYLDWSGLRPMTELEYEKACRGPQVPVTNEFAWGNTSIYVIDSIFNAGTLQESNLTTGANAIFGNYLKIKGPVRVGIFATEKTSRTMSGASYYGIFELSGNVWETVGYVMDNPLFTGLHGDGDMFTKIESWPGAQVILGHFQMNFRGGGWSGNPVGISIRTAPYNVVNESYRSGSTGGRGVRTAPL